MSANLPFGKYTNNMLQFPLIAFKQCLRAMAWPIIFGVIAQIMIMAPGYYFLYFPYGIDGGIEDAFDSLAYIDTVSETSSWQYILYQVTQILGSLVTMIFLFGGMHKLMRLITLDEPIEKWFHVGFNIHSIRLTIIMVMILVFALIPAIIAAAIGYLISHFALNADEALWVGIMGGIGYFLGYIYLLVKSLPAFAGTSTYERIYFFDSWALTRGHFWTMLWALITVGIGFMMVMMMIFIVFYIILAILIMPGFVTENMGLLIGGGVIATPIVIIFYLVVYAAQYGIHAAACALPFRRLEMGDEWEDV